MTKEQKKCIFNMDRKSMYFKINFTLIIMLTKVSQVNIHSSCD